MQDSEIRTFAYNQGNSDVCVQSGNLFYGVRILDEVAVIYPLRRRIHESLVLTGRNAVMPIDAPVVKLDIERPIHRVIFRVSDVTRFVFCPAVFTRLH